jgi:hypothetical protein
VQGRSDLVMNLAGAVGGAVSGPLLAWLTYAGLAWSLALPIVLVVATSLVTTAGVGRGQPVGGSVRSPGVPGPDR